MTPRARRHFQREDPRAPIRILDRAGDLDLPFLCDVIDDIRRIHFDHQVRVRESLTEPDFYSGFARVELHAFAATAVPRLALRQPQRGKKLHQRLVIFLALGDD